MLKILCEISKKNLSVKPKLLLRVFNEVFTRALNIYSDKYLLFSVVPTK